jgi:glycosyltransferase involved in cell wall biosynthesis
LGPLRVAGCETIYTMHGPFETELYSWFRNPARFFPRFFSRQSLRFASQVVCVSETVGEIARRSLPTEQVKVIANWVQPPLTFRHNFSVSERPRLLFVGRLEEYKGVQFILRAIEQVGDVSLTIVGEGPYRAELEREASQMDVRFAGFQPDPSRFYQDSTVFINPSIGPEGLPLVSLEAMACGLPCIFSDLPVHREISAGGKAAALFTAGDSESLAHQLKLLLEDEGHRRQYGVAARQLVEQQYSRSVAGQQYLQAFGL